MHKGSGLVQGARWGYAAEYETRDYMLHREKALTHELAEVAGIAEYIHRLGVKIGNNVFTGLDRVSPRTYTSRSSCPTSTFAYSNI